DRLITGEVGREGGRLTAAFHVYDSDGNAIASGQASAARGDVLDLALGVAQRAAAPASAELNPRVAASLGELRPFVRASSAMARDDMAAAVQALELADPAVAARVVGAR